MTLPHYRYPKSDDDGTIDEPMGNDPCDDGSIDEPVGDDGSIDEPVGDDPCDDRIDSLQMLMTVNKEFSAMLHADDEYMELFSEFPTLTFNYIPYNVLKKFMVRYPNHTPIENTHYNNCFAKMIKEERK